MIEIIKKIASYDFPNTWTNFLPSIIEKIKSSDDFQEVYGSLLALYSIFRYYKDTLGLKPEIELLVNNSFNFLELFAEKLLNDYGLQAASALHIILKIFQCATYVPILLLITC